MTSGEKYNDKWIGLYFIPFAAVFVYFIGDDLLFFEASLNIRDLIYILLNIASGLIVWQIVKKTMVSFIKEEITLLLILKAFSLNLFVSLVYLISTRFLHDIHILNIPTNIQYYTIDLPINVLFISIINLIYLLLFYMRKAEQQPAFLAAELDPTQKILIQSSKKRYAFIPSEIAFIELENKVTYLYTYSGERIATVHSLNQIFQQLPESHFFLANRQFVLHRDVIRSYLSTDTRKLQVQLLPALDFNKEIFISKAKSHAFKHWL